MSTTDTFNGWTNYETWVCNLWINNTQDSQEYWQVQAREACKNPVENQYLEEHPRMVHALTNTLRDHFEKQAETWMPSQYSFFSDILREGLYQINWYEIASYMIDNLEEN